MSEAPIGIIGGTGITHLTEFQVTGRRVVPTPYGEPSAPVLLGHLGGRETYLIARHGSGHTIPPHLVNYRANLWALKYLGVGQIVAISSVGGIHKNMAPGELVTPDQIIDYTWGRPGTIYESVDERVVHTEFTEPYSDSVRTLILAAGDRAGVNIHDGGVYGATQGPRLETAAEIERMRRDGCDMVGMTGMPEAVLARELELDYAACALVINWAAGRGEGDILGQIEAHIASCMSKVRRILTAL
ncbi:MAG: 5'-methylthioadenosine phosphorylase [Gammaproteobacteria bacterium SG8_31]|jgi:5'-methylthioinosine phosphorylase|nr:MAG: 5'-methylthioadenosine phosphorylase [Gammaproteobacteria bacterium SG8_31]